MQHRLGEELPYRRMGNKCSTSIESPEVKTINELRLEMNF